MENSNYQKYYFMGLLHMHKKDFLRQENGVPSV